MRLRTWAISTSDDAAGSAANSRYLDWLLRRGCLATGPGVTISMDQTEEQGLPCIRLKFHLPQESHSNGVTSIPVLLPTAFVGTNQCQTFLIFYALIEEVIGWLAHIGPKHSLIRLHQQNNGQPLPRSYSSGWQDLHSGFALFISSMRESQGNFPGLGQFNCTSGVMEVAQARTSSDEITSDYLVSLTLSNKQRMSLFLPRRVAILPRDFMLDWLEVQNEFSTRLV